MTRVIESVTVKVEPVYMYGMHDYVEIQVKVKVYGQEEWIHRRRLPEDQFKPLFHQFMETAERYITNVITETESQGDEK